jgi:uncharacterized protein (DUF433 family)
VPVRPFAHRDFGGRMDPMAVTFEGFDRITADPAMLGGKPCIRGMRISVKQVLNILATNPSWDDLREDYPELDSEDVRQALVFAAASLDDGIVPLQSA